MGGAQRSANESVGVKPNRWLRFKFWLWLLRVSLIDSHMPWTKHFIVFVRSAFSHTLWTPVSSGETSGASSVT